MLIFAYHLSFINYYHPSLLFLDISGGEILLILLVAYILFGPKKLGEIAQKIGKVVRDIKKASEKIRNEINEEAYTLKKGIDDIKNNTIDKKEEKN